MNRKGRTALVTGGGRGIGRAIAIQLAKDGYDVIVTYNTSVQKTQMFTKSYAEQGYSLLAEHCDISQTYAIEKLFSTIQFKHPPLAVLVNNAAISNTLSIDEIDEYEWDKMLDTNLKSVFFCSKKAFQLMRNENYGRIISLSSIAGQRGGHYSAAHYTAAKGGVMSMMKSFALSGAPFNITANCVSPGVVKTEMSEQEGIGISGIPLNRMAYPEEIAHAVSFLAAEESAYITGVTLDVNGGQLMR